MAEAMAGARRASWLVTVLLVIAIPLLAIWPLELASNLYDEKRLLVVTLLLVLAVLLAVAGPLRRLWQRRIVALPVPVSLSLLAILLLGLLSASKAQLPGAALAEIALWAMLLTLLTLVAAVRGDLQEAFDQMVTAMLAVILFSYLLVVCGYLLQAVAGERALDFRKLFVNFSHLRYFNQFQSWTLPLAVLPVLYAQARGWKVLQLLFALAAANWWLLLILSGGRGTAAAMVIAMVVMALLFRHRVTQWLKWQLITAAGGVLLYLLVAQLATLMADGVIANPALVRGSLSGREELWQLALTMISEYPLLGVGPMHYACTEPVLAGHPHNAPLQIAAEWGLPVLLLVSGVVWWLLYRAAMLTRRQTAPTAHADIAPLLLASLLTAALHAQLCGIIVTPISQLMLALIGGWLWGALLALPAGSPVWRWPHTLWSIVIATALVALVNVVSPLWRDVVNGTIAKADQAQLFMPRFWIDGALCREASVWRH